MHIHISIFKELYIELTTETNERGITCELGQKNVY